MQKHWEASIQLNLLFMHKHTHVSVTSSAGPIHNEKCTLRLYVQYWRLLPSDPRSTKAVLRYKQALKKIQSTRNIIPSRLQTHTHTIHISQCEQKEINAASKYIKTHFQDSEETTNTKTAFFVCMCVCVCVILKLLSGTMASCLKGHIGVIKFSALL